jgi:hypothetical protein
MYDKPFITRYLDHCRTKASQVIAAETEERLVSPCGFRVGVYSRVAVIAGRFQSVG